MVSDQYREAVERCRALFQPLLWRARYHMAGLPMVAHLNEQCQRVGRFLGQPRFDGCARAIRKDRQDKITAFYSEFRGFTKDVVAAFEELRGILPEHEVTRLISEADPRFVAGTCRGVQRTAQRIEEFWQGLQNAPDLAETAPASVAQHHAGSAELQLVAPRSVPKQHSRSITNLRAAEKLRVFMEKHGLNISQLYERMRRLVSTKTLGKFLKTGTATSSTLDAVAATMGMSKEKLLE